MHDDHKGYVRVHMPSGATDVRYIAARPVDRRASFSGSGLPYTNARQAFEGTPYHGRAKVLENDLVEIRVSATRLPGAYYADMKGTLVPPTIYLWWKDGTSGETRRGHVVVSAATPFRSISMPRRPEGQARAVKFYDNEVPVVRSQEAILIASAYPSADAERGNAREPVNFWGTRPPV